MNRVVGTKSREEFSLALWSDVGQGGEGKVFSLNGRCVKVYSKPLAQVDMAKIEALSRLAPNVPGFAWPTELVAESLTGTPVGFVMDLVPGESLDSLLVDRLTKELPESVKVTLALQVARAVDAAHKCSGPKVVLGDVLKAGNLILDVENVSAVFVDAASVSLFGFRVASGEVKDSWSWLKTPGYVPKEELDNPGAIPSHDADRFALAVLLFEILFGRSPHLPKPCSAAIGLDPDEAVRKGLFFRWVSHPEFDPPEYDPIDVPSDVESLFRAAFLVSAVRPKADEWCVELEKWLSALTPEPEPLPDVPPMEPSRSAWIWLIDHPLIFAVLAWLISSIVQTSLDQFAPGVSESLPLPSRLVGPSLFRELFP